LQELRNWSRKCKHWSQTYFTNAKNWITAADQRLEENAIDGREHLKYYSKYSSSPEYKKQHIPVWWKENGSQVCIKIRKQNGDAEEACDQSAKAWT